MTVKQTTVFDSNEQSDNDIRLLSNQDQEESTAEIIEVSSTESNINAQPTETPTIQDNKDDKPVQNLQKIDTNTTSVDIMTTITEKGKSDKEVETSEASIMEDGHDKNDRIVEGENLSVGSEIRDIVAVEEFYQQEITRVELEQSTNEVSKEYDDDNDKKPKALEQLDGIPTDYKFYVVAGIDTVKKQCNGFPEVCEVIRDNTNTYHTVTFYTNSYDASIEYLIKHGNSMSDVGSTTENHHEVEEVLLLKDNSAQDDSSLLSFESSFGSEAEKNFQLRNSLEKTKSIGLQPIQQESDEVEQDPQEKA